MSIGYNLWKSYAPAVFTQTLFPLIMVFAASVFQNGKIRTQEENKSEGQHVLIAA